MEYLSGQHVRSAFIAIAIAVSPAAQPIIFADGWECPAELSDTFSNAAATGRFLTQASFGPTPDDLATLPGTSSSAWFRSQLDASPSLTLPQVLSFRATLDQEADFVVLLELADHFAFWRNAFTADDQLRQRMAYALSQILVVSDAGGEVLSDIGESMAAWQDVLITHALGNYRDLLSDVTRSPAMGFYLTYMGNQRGDSVTGRLPDENYARELLQLFTIGLVQLNADGTVVRDSSGTPLETYTNADITGLARVFTGLDLDIGQGVDTAPDFTFREMSDAWSRPMQQIADRHSLLPKQFLGQEIPAGTSLNDSIEQALDIIFAHPNVGPFIGRQLIQRLVSSHPEPAYVGRVTAAFDAGSYRLPDGSTVGTGRRGDLAATVAAVLFDIDARTPSPGDGALSGKPREPVLRFTAWGRAFAVRNVRPEYVPMLWNMSEDGQLAQFPYRARSVFNFYRPGYVAPSTESGAAGLTVPEFQLATSTTVPGYANFMRRIVRVEKPEGEIEDLRFTFAAAGLSFDQGVYASSFIPDYAPLLALAGDGNALVDELARRLSAGRVSTPTRQTIVDALAVLDEDENERVIMAIWLFLTSPDFLVQR
ncbi:MAG: DUF1800 domain-containing protein [Pseudomonadota bacterium]